MGARLLVTIFPRHARIPTPGRIMIRGIGIDIVATDRMSEALERHGGRMKTRLFTPAEIAYCDARHTPVLHYAARFAAKEAFSKALGTGMAKGMGWKDFSVENAPGGEPIAVLSDNGRAMLARRGANRVHVSLAHDKGVAVAVVAIED